MATIRELVGRAVESAVRSLAMSRAERKARRQRELEYQRMYQAQRRTRFGVSVPGQVLIRCLTRSAADRVRRAVRAWLALGNAVSFAQAALAESMAGARLSVILAAFAAVC